MKPPLKRAQVVAAASEAVALGDPIAPEGMLALNQPAERVACSASGTPIGPMLRRDWRGPRYSTARDSRRVRGWSPTR